MAEAFTIVGLIGAIVNITDVVIETYKLAKDVHKLPKAFSVINERMPVVRNTLVVIESSYRGSGDESAIYECFNTCKEDAEKLKYIFEQVCLAEGEGTVRRYQKALRNLKPGRGDKVETLFKGILDTLQTLQAFHIFKNVLPIDELSAAIEEVANIEPSIDEDLSTTIHSSGTGAMFNTGLGEMRIKQVNGDGNYQAETMNFQAPVVYGKQPYNPTLARPYFDSMLLDKRVSPCLYMARPIASKNLDVELKKRKNKNGLRYAVVVHGIGGTGKTQLVIQYAEEHRSEYSMVIYLDAESPLTFTWSCRRVCHDLQLLDWRDGASGRQALVPQQSPAVYSIREWLGRRPASDNWLVILDNANDISWGIREVFPHGTAGSLIITTQDAGVVSALRCGELALDSMEIEEAKTFLRIAAFPDLDDTSEQLEELCSNVGGLLGCHPLAVHLAASTISRTFMRVKQPLLADACAAVELYLDEFKKDKDEVLMRGGGVYFQSSYPRTVLTTFETTFAKLAEEEIPAGEPSPMILLSLLASVEERSVVQFHERLRQAYSGIRSDYQCREYAKSWLPRWLSKVLTGESSFGDHDLASTNWNYRGYSQSLDRLQRFGLVRATSHGLPEILPMHEIVRWRVQRQADGDVDTRRGEYAVILELALSSTMHDPNGSLQISNELADLYRNIGAFQNAQHCARVHLKRQIELFERHGASTIQSLARLIEILREEGSSIDAEYEIFAFVRDADDRQAIFENLPADLSLLLDSVFRQHPMLDTPKQSARRRIGKERHLLKDGYSRVTVETAMDNPFAHHDQSMQTTTMWPMQQEDMTGPNLPAQGIHSQLLKHMELRERALEKAATAKPDLVTLFEVFSTGSEDLISRYMHHVDNVNVHYRDPLGSRTLLHYLAAYGTPKDVQACLEMGSDVSARDNSGATPLHVAGQVGRSEVFRALVEGQSHVFSKDNAGRTPLDYAQQRLDFLPSVGGSERNASLQRVIIEHSASEAVCLPQRLEPELSFARDNYRRSSHMGNDVTHHAYVEDYSSSDEGGDVHSERHTRSLDDDISSMSTGHWSNYNDSGWGYLEQDNYSAVALCGDTEDLGGRADPLAYSNEDNHSAVAVCGDSEDLGGRADPYAQTDRSASVDGPRLAHDWTGSISPRPSKASSNRGSASIGDCLRTGQSTSEAQHWPESVEHTTTNFVLWKPLDAPEKEAKGESSTSPSTTPLQAPAPSRPSSALAPSSAEQQAPNDGSGPIPGERRPLHPIAIAAITNKYQEQDETPENMSMSSSKRKEHGKTSTRSSTPSQRSQVENQSNVATRVDKVPVSLLAQSTNQATGSTSISFETKLALRPKGSALKSISRTKSASIAIGHQTATGSKPTIPSHEGHKVRRRHRRISTHVPSTPSASQEQEDRPTVARARSSRDRLSRNKKQRQASESNASGDAAKARGWRRQKPYDGRSLFQKVWDAFTKQDKAGKRARRR